MKTQNQKYQERIQQQIEFNQKEALRLRKQVYPEDFNLPEIIEEQLTKYEQFQLQIKRDALNYITEKANSLIVKLRYN